MNDEQRRVALFQAQPEGLGLFFRPAALSFAHVAELHIAHSALLDEKTALAEPIGLVLTGPKPDEKRLRRACGRACRVVVYPYAERSAAIWWRQNEAAYRRFENLSVIKLSVPGEPALSELACKNMALSCTIQEGQIWLGDANRAVTLEQQRWM